jgi:hypothetical protein
VTGAFQPAYANPWLVCISAIRMSKQDAFHHLLEFRRLSEGLIPFKTGSASGRVYDSGNCLRT